MNKYSALSVSVGDQRSEGAAPTLARARHALLNHTTPKICVDQPILGTLYGLTKSVISDVLSAREASKFFRYKDQQRVPLMSSTQGYI